MAGCEPVTDLCGSWQEHSAHYEAVQMEHAQGGSLAAASVVKDMEPPEHFVCPISSDLMVDPVMCADGHCCAVATNKQTAAVDEKPTQKPELPHEYICPITQEIMQGGFPSINAFNVQYVCY